MMLRKVFLPLLGFWLVFLFLSAATVTGQNIPPDLVAAQDRTRSVEERSRTILALGRSGDAQASGPLLQILKDPSEPQRVRASTVIALSRIGQPRSEILSAYEASYRSPATDKNLRYTLLHALGQMRAAESLSLLSEALAAGDDGIRFKAAQALGMVGGDSAVKVLISRFESERDRMVRAEIVRALGGNESPSVEGLLVRALRTDPEPLVRYNAALSLVKFKSLSTEGQEALRAAGEDPSPMVRKTVREGGR
jgi:HEAT repeat protein